MTNKQRKRALERKGEKLKRLAYELESDAAALRHIGGAERYANGCNGLASTAGDIGRALLDIAESI